MTPKNKDKTGREGGSGKQSRGQKVMVFIRGYKASELPLGPVTLGVLRLEREEWEEKNVRKGLTAVDTLLDYASRLKRYPWTRDMDYVEIIVESKGLRAMYGGRPGYGWKKMIYQTPSKLVKVGVAEIDGDTGGRVTVEEAGIEWFHVPSDAEYYVFEGECKVPAGRNLLVVVETSEGRRILTAEACSAS